MKIVFTVSAMYAGGAEKVATTIANNLAKKGHNVVIVLVSAREESSFHEIDNNVSVLPLLKNQKRSNIFHRVKLLKNCLTAINPDIVIAFLPHICIYTAFALKHTGIPFICSERNDPHKYSLIYKVLLKYAFKKASGAVFQTKDALQWYKVKNGIVINNPISLVYQPSVPCRLENKTVVFVGRISKQKNYKMLIKSFIEFSKLYPDFSLHVYGEGEGKEYIIKCAKKANISEKVLMCGKTNKWQENEYASFLFVSTSDFEGMPNALAEAAALGLRCVATDCPIGGTRSLSYSFPNIYLSKKGNYKLFALDMERVIKKDRAQFKVPESYTVESVSMRWLLFIENILSLRKF